MTLLILLEVAQGCARGNDAEEATSPYPRKRYLDDQQLWGCNLSRTFEIREQSGRTSNININDGIGSISVVRYSTMWLEWRLSNYAHNLDGLLLLSRSECSLWDTQDLINGMNNTVCGKNVGFDDS
jgi:hypothetical protein